jgi:hypothetical protein
VSLSVTAADERSGLVGTEYRLAGAPDWSPYTAPFSVAAQGISTYEVRSVDAAGNTGATSATVRIDKGRPATRVLAAASVRRSRKATLRFRINDTFSPKARVTVKIYRRGASKPKKTLRLGLRATNKNTRYAGYVCKLPRGAYIWKVYATDLAGNTQKKPGSGSLKVK